MVRLMFMQGETPLQKQASMEEEGSATVPKLGKRRRCCCCCVVLIILLAVILIAAAVVVPIVVLKLKHQPSTPLIRGARAIDLACGATRFPQTCNSSLYAYPASLDSQPEELTALAVSAATAAVTDTYTQCRNISEKPEISTNVTLASIVDDCFQLLGFTLGQLNASYTRLSSATLEDLQPDFEDLKTSLSGALTFHGTCTDGLSQIDSIDGENLRQQGNHSFQVVSNALAFVNTLSIHGDDVEGWEPTYFQTHAGGGTLPPPAASPTQRKLLSSSPQNLDTRKTRISDSSSSSFSSSSSLSSSSLLYEDFLPRWLRSEDSKLSPPAVDPPPPCPISSFWIDAFSILRSWLHPGTKSLLENSNADLSLSSSKSSSSSFLVDEITQLPSWLGPADRKLLEESTTDANVTVAQDGSGTYNTVQQAVDAAPIFSNNRYVIYIKEGVYDEIVRISNQTQNVMLLGDGINQTIITGNLNVQQPGITTFKSATVSVAGKGFIAKGITFQNTAGAIAHQAVALRVSADKCAFWQCSMDGFQDTLWAHAFRQFYKDCTIYGTVDFVFGNAAAIFQTCTLLARTNLPGQQNVYTAQGRTDPGQNTGFSIQNCTLDGTPDMLDGGREISTYLGRPWKLYSLTVYLKSTISAIVDPSGWLPWSGDFALSTLYYAEYDNQGPGANTQARVNWSTVITDPSLVTKFQVGEFLDAEEWLPNTSIPYTDSL